MTRRDSLLAAARRRLVRSLCGAAIGLALAPVAGATICKYVDPDGNVVYSNVAQGKGLRRISCDIASDVPQRGPSDSARSTSTPSNFPRVEPATQKSRDDMRRKVLNDELASEERLLAEAREAYGSGAPKPLADEQNDAERYRQRIGRLRQSVQLHERNVEALRKEIAAIR
jgi:hypothetical protein